MTDKEPPRWIKAVMHADLFLLGRVFMPISHWIDWRFHINQFDQAATVLSLGLAMNAADNLNGFMRMPTIGWIGVIASGALIFAYGRWLKMLNIASKKYEKRPDMISLEHRFFMFVFLPPLRLFMLILGTALEAATVPMYFSAPTTGGLVHLLTDWWMIPIGCALYIAGGLPPMRDRKEKKAWAGPQTAPMPAS